jgi:hypothetical protein
MADEREIILKLQIDADKSITNLLAVKDRIAKLKDEQKALNTSTVEGRKTYEAYQGQIKALTKEQNSLQNAVSQTAGAMEFEAGSIAANRAELSKLTAEYKNLANPTKEQTKAIKDLSDTLKEQEAAIGNTSRNVGNYREEINEALKSNGLYANSLGAVQGGLGTLQKGISGAKLGFTGLRGAIIASGLGALAILLLSIFSYFKNTNEGSKLLAQGMAGLKAVTGVLVDLFSGLGKTLVGLFENPTQSLKDFAKNLKEFVIDRLNILLGGVKGIGTAFKQLFAGEFTEAAKTAGKAFVDINRAVNPLAIAVDLLGDTFTDAFNKAKEGATAAIRLEAMMQKLITAERSLTIETARRRGEVERLEKVADDTAAKSEDRVKSLRESIAIQNKLTEDEVRLAERRLSIIQQQNAITDSSEDDLQKEADALVKVIELRNQQAVKVQDLNNKMNALILSINAEAEARAKAERLANESLELQRLNNQIRLNELELQTARREGLIDREIELLQNQKRLELEILEATTQAELQNQELLEADKIRIIETAEVTRQEIEAKYAEQRKKNVEKDAAVIVQTYDEKFREFFTRLAEQFTGFANVINQALSVASQAISVKLESDIQKNDKQREDELKKFGRTQAQRDKINERFDKIEERRRSQAAKDDAFVKQIQAAINTATGVTQALAQGGVAGIVTGALVAAAGALQITAIEQSKTKLAKGGLIPIGGNLHSNGGTTFRGTDGTVFEAERGEVLAVVNRHDAPKLGYLSAINSVHGTPFYGSNRPPMKRNHFADGGLVARNNSQDAVLNANQRSYVIEAMKAMPPIITKISDINNVAGIVNEVRVRADVTR